MASIFLSALSYPTESFLVKSTRSLVPSNWYADDLIYLISRTERIFTIMFANFRYARRKYRRKKMDGASAMDLFETISHKSRDGISLSSSLCLLLLTPEAGTVISSTFEPHDDWNISKNWSFLKHTKLNEEDDSRNKRRPFKFSFLDFVIHKKRKGRSFLSDI